MSTILLEIILPCSAISWNRIVTSHWRVYKRIKDEMAMYTLKALQDAPQAEILPTAYPVAVSVHARWKDKRHRDIDNIYGKAVLDFLVKRGILAGDDTRYVRSVMLTGEIGCEKDEIIFTINP